MTRYLPVLMSLLVFTAMCTSAEPFSGGDYQLSAGGKDEMVWFESDGSSGILMTVGKFFPAGQLGVRDSMVVNTKSLRGRWQGGMWDYPECLVKDIDNDDLGELVIPYYADSTKVRVQVFKPNPASVSLPRALSFTDSATLDLGTPPPALFTGASWTRPVNIAMADFDGDGRNELALVHQVKASATDSMRLVLRLVEITDSLDLSQRGYNLGPQLRPSRVRSEGYVTIYDAAAADLDGSGKSDLMVVSNATFNASTWGVLLSRYTYNTAADTFALDTQIAVYTTTQTDSLQRVSIKGGHFSSRIREDALVMFSTASRDSMIAVNDNGSLRVTGINRPVASLPSALVDVNNDSLLEMIYHSYDGLLTCYQFSAAFGLVPKGSSGFPGSFFNQGNIMPDVGNRVSTEFLRTYYSMAPDNRIRTQLLSLVVDSLGAVTGVDTVADCMGDYSSSMSFGDLDGDVRLGTPRQFRVTNIVQPMVILNAPPIHFDVFGASAFDVSRAYNANTCLFAANYSKTASTTTEVQTTFNRDWGVSASVSTDHDFWIAKVKSHFTAKYGEKFSKVAGSSQTVTVSVSINAKEDDRIYATVMDYTVWEYPIFVNDTKRGNILVVDPARTEDRWFPSKSWSGYSYQPTHEVGNILSYPEYADFSQNPLLDESIKGEATSSYSLDANSDLDWSLMFSDFTSASATTEKNWGLEMGASVEAWGVELGIEGTYSGAEISTQTTKVSTELNMSVHLDALDMSLGEVSYRVTPYAYWARNGALVLDYAAMPELSPLGGTPTWWQTRYGSLADPTFILPWRYDPEKGFALGDDTKRQQTKDIQFFPREVVAGDTVTISARVYNFSLMQTSAPVTVRFYVGDPDNGGTRISDINGRDSVLTPAIISARGMQTVSIKWRVPAVVRRYPCIYAVLDPANRFNEVHENNNKGWNILGKTDDMPVAVRFYRQANVSDHRITLPGASRTLVFTLPGKAAVRIDLIDVSGRKVGTVVNGAFGSGSHSALIGRNLSAGMYVCRMSVRAADGSVVVLAKQLLLP